MSKQPPKRPVIAGAAAAAAGLGAAELAAALAGQPPLVDALGRIVVDAGPRPLVDLTVGLLGRGDKPAIRASVLAGIAALGGLAGAGSVRSPRRGDLVAGGTVLAGMAAALRRPPRQPARLLLAGSCGALAAAGVLRARRPGIRPAAAAAGLVALIGARGVNRAQRAAHDRQRERLMLRPSSPKPPAADQAETWPGISPLITPTADFYITDVNLGAPLIDPAAWRLRLRGLVEHPLELSLPDLAGLGLTEFDAVMVCIHNAVGGDRVGNARWLGVPLTRLLALASPSPRATTLITRAVDGFTTSLPLRRPGAMPDSYVVVGMNGRPLTSAHGFPARVVTPGLYGQYTGVKWLTDLVVAADPQPDYWTPRGWPQQPVPVRPMARIDTPATGDRRSSPVHVGGVAWAPTAGVERVEVSIDSDPWQPAELARELAPASWRRWRLPARLDPGTHRIQARAISRSGEVQDPTPRPSFPTGASGLHTVHIHVAHNPAEATLIAGGRPARQPPASPASPSAKPT
jgi:DMSO/TMAO reductase YedYZ molybdopterin-dependent catalytic subunit